jgi:hypothetical protein
VRDRPVAAERRDVGGELAEGAVDAGGAGTEPGSDAAELVGRDAMSPTDMRSSCGRRALAARAGR